MKIQTERITLSGDLATPVGLFLSLRDQYSGALLLESSDYHAATNASSFICLEPMEGIFVEKDQIYRYTNGQSIPAGAANRETLLPALQSFLGSIELDNLQATDGIYGYFGHGSVRYFEDVEPKKQMDNTSTHPELIFHLYRHVIHLNHFNDTMAVHSYFPEGTESGTDRLLNLLNNQQSQQFPFMPAGEISSTSDDEGYRQMVEHARQHCKRGDVFQLVLSRRFSMPYKGDDFNVYRALRRINPSPYLYYLDYSSFRIFGSSPESQLRITNRVATLNPIAGTYRRTGNDETDKVLAQQLTEDPKENAEHAMLVDLARNDLSRSCKEVEVDTYKEVQFFSHVIHLVSKVSGKLREGVHPLKVVADTFPAGTLSGAPKHRALQLIDRYEKAARGFYGGAVGFIGLNGDVNLAILIRSFLSKNNKLYFQAGAGIVDASSAESELQEVNNKLGALRKAINAAKTSQL